MNRDKLNKTVSLLIPHNFNNATVNTLDIQCTTTLVRAVAEGGHSRVYQNASKFYFQRVHHISVSGMTSKLIPECFINLSLSYLLDLDSCIFAIFKPISWVPKYKKYKKFQNKIKNTSLN